MFSTPVKKKLSRRKLVLALLLICFAGIGVFLLENICTDMCKSGFNSGQYTINPQSTYIASFTFSRGFKNCTRCGRLTLGSKVAFHPGNKGVNSITPNLRPACLEKCLGSLEYKERKESIIGTYVEETSIFICKIKCNMPFAYTRWNDGELDTLTGWNSKTRIRMSRIEGWTTEKNTLNGLTLNADLLRSLEIRDPNFFYGFNYPSCGEGLVIQQLSGGGSWKWVSQFTRLNVFPPVKQLTYADLLSGRNYHYFGMKELLFHIAREKNCTVFANKRAKRNKKIPWFDRIVTFDADLTGNWFKKKNLVIRDVTTMAKSKSSHMFLIALGPISNILIAYMWKANPHNTYIDVGSALNEFHGFGSQARAYMRNPTCQAIGPTCTPMRYRPNLMIGSSTDFTIRNFQEIDKLRCCTPIIPNCSLTLERWYPPVNQKGHRRLTCKGILSKVFIVKHVGKLCRCADKESAERVANCLAASIR